MADEEPREIQKWEYLFCPPDLIGNIFYYTDLGERGWEFICVVPETSHSCTCALFKRPKGGSSEGFHPSEGEEEWMRRWSIGEFKRSSLNPERSHISDSEEEG